MSKLLIAWIILLFWIHDVHAQNRAIDSINRLISKSNTDTQRIRLGAVNVSNWSEVNIDSSIRLGKSLIIKAIQIKYKEGEADILTNMAASYCRKGNYDSALHGLQEVQQILDGLNDFHRQSNMFSIFGMMYGMQGKYDTSIQYYKKAIDIAERTNQETGLSSLYGNLAIGYQMQSNFPEALLYQQKSLRLAEKKNNASSQAYTLMNIGNTYQDMGDTAKAEAAILRGIELAKSIGIKNVELYGYSNLASVYSGMRKPAKAYEFGMKAANLSRIVGDAGIESASLAKAATALADMKRFPEAVKLGERAIIIADSSTQPYNIHQAYTSMGYILRYQGKYSDAIVFYLHSIRALKDADMYDNAISVTYAGLADCYENTGEFDKSLQAFKRSATIIDSIRSKDNVRKATELTMNYEFEKKQNLATLLQEKKNEEAKAKQTLLLVGLGLTLIIAVIAWKAFQNKQKANSLLEQQKEALQQTLGQLKNTQSQLIQSEKMASLGELTAGIAHEIQNPLNFVNNFSELNTELIDELNTEQQKTIRDFGYENNLVNDIRENSLKINHHGKRADAIVKGMLQHSRSSSGQKELSDLNALADEYLRLSYHGLRAKDKTFNATINTDFAASVEQINIIPQDIGRALLNLYNNAFYAVAEKKKQQPEGYDPVVSVTTRKLAGRVEITVKDNGNGIPPKALDKIFQPFFTTKPTGEGTGLGLSLCYDIITKGHNGDLKVETKEGEGTAFIIGLPVPEK